MLGRKGIVQPQKRRECVVFGAGTKGYRPAPREASVLCSGLGRKGIVQPQERRVCCVWGWDEGVSSSPKRGECVSTSQPASAAS